jgi:hypothetical protein
MLEWACFGTGVGGKLPVPAVRRGKTGKSFIILHSNISTTEGSKGWKFIHAHSIASWQLKNKVNKDLKKKNNNVTYLISSSDLARNQ